MVNLEYYRVFVYVAKLKSITLAAEELHISQPAISQTIKNLEIALGGTLFVRTPKGVRLTPEGDVLYSYVSQGYEYLMQAENKYRELLQLDTGEIRIGASDMTLQFYLLPYLEKFNRMYPKIKIQVTNGPTPETLDYLRAGKIDFGVVSAPVTKIKGVNVLPVYKIQDIFVAGNRFFHLQGQVVELSQLAEYPIICLEPNTSTRKYVDSFLKDHGTELNPEFELATSDLIVQFATRGLGIGCVVKNFAEKQLTDSSLFELSIETQIPPRDICIVTCEKTPVSPAGKKLLFILQP